MVNPNPRFPCLGLKNMVYVVINRFRVSTIGNIARMRIFDHNQREKITGIIQGTIMR